ncbi:VirB4 family type IV secretion system protein [Tunturibacter empetritectus]|uniref:Type IV secretion system protein VirB4 n=1 Tax=Tunturiibacter empetritectus TaxID=3069691 RepID=A0A7W8ILR5_9BACT|nr:type VI secretion protein [Edaphobacter lichenicola]MBB5319459.1 type IV secretion system protein VirB4 [Edaphobacter lichenicola]
MTRVNANQWFTDAKAANSIVPIARFVSPTVFATKSSGYGCLFSVTGVDEEGLTDQELDARIRAIEGGLRGLPEGACLYQYMRVTSGFAIPRKAKYDDPITQSFVEDRLAFLDKTANFRRIDLHWCLTFEPELVNPFAAKPKDKANENARLLADLQKAASILETHLNAHIGIQLLEKEQTFQFFCELFNLEEWAGETRLIADTGVDQQIVSSAVSWESDHLRIGKRYVQMFTMTSTPVASQPCLFSGITNLNCDSVLCTTWRPKSAASVRKEIGAQEKWLDFFKVGIFQRVMAGRNFAALDKGAGAKAASEGVDDLSLVVTELGKKAQGEYTARLLLSSRTADELRDNAPMVHRIFVDAQASIIEETLGNLSAFYAMFPGNNQFSVFPLWLGEDHHARLSPVFAPHIGYPLSDDLDNEYLNVFETRQGTPFFQDVYVNGVRVMLIIGPPGTGKSVHTNQMLGLERKYNGFTYIFDIGNSYESMVELYGGRVDRIGLDGPRVNPFALEPTEKNIKFLYNFVKLLVTNGGADLSPEDEDVIFKEVQSMYLLDPKNRRLSNLLLPKHLNRYLAKWVGTGVYNAIFDNVEDSLSLSRIQCWDFAGVAKDYSDLIEPLMVWLLRRIDDVVYDPRNLGVPKHVVIEEIFSNMKNKQLLEGALASIKQVRKNLGGVTMIGQSANDLGENADSIVNSCTSILLLPDATFNRKFYGELFKMTDQQLNLFESLGAREALYLRRDGLTKVVTLNLDPRSYAIFSTRPKDRARRGRLIAKWGLQEGITKFVSGEDA